jgi:hypothetical protein
MNQGSLQSRLRLYQSGKPFRERKLKSLFPSLGKPK